MKKLILASLIALFSVPAMAAEIGDTYFGPTIGYHFFDNDHDLDDKAEGGLRLGYFFMDDHSAELEADYTSTDHKTEGDTSATSLSISGLKFWDVTPKFKPFLLAGVGGLFHENDMGSLVLGVGAQYMFSDNLSFDFRVKDMIHSIGARNDVIPSVGVNFHFGKAPAAAPMVKEEPKPEPKAEPKKDSDGDGVFDEADQCPTTPKGYPVNNAGCTPDTDKDGVYDFQDDCITPEGWPVNAKGCSPDTDGDGIYDFEDRCPNSMKGVKVNSAGCFISATLKINFKTNSSAIDESYLENLQQFAVFLKASPNVDVEIQGHTDSKGAASYNKALSQKRADSVVKLLSTKYGISKNRLTAVGYGEDMPLVPNDSPANMLKNRRIDTVVK